MSNKKNIKMSYYLKAVKKDSSFEDTIDLLKTELAKEGFGVPAEVDVKSVFKAKLGVDYRNYRILGACNPEYAKRAIDSEKDVGVFLPCSVVVQENENGDIEISAVDSVVSLAAVSNPVVNGIAEEIKSKLERVIAAIG